MFDAKAALAAVVPHLDRGDAPPARWPDRKGEYWPLCPFHADTHSGSFAVSERGYHCFSCGAKSGLVDLARRLNIDLNFVTSSLISGGITDKFISLAAYAEAKHLPEDFFRTVFNISERKHNQHTSLRMPYLDAEGAELCVRLRISLDGRDKFRMAAGSRLNLYGLWRLDKDAEDVLLVEGESDTQTLVYHGIPALGVPGATNWRAEWAQRLAGRTVYAWQEPDEAGAKFIARIGADVPDLRVIAAPAAYKDISAAHIAGEDVPALIARLKAASQPYAELRAETLDQTARQAARVAGRLLKARSILDEFAALCARLGLVGEERNARLLYLALVSRLLEHPVSVAVKGPSSGGKSFTVETVLKCFPPDAYYAMSSMSERALAYDEEPLAHRFLVIYEADGLGGDLATYLLRSLLSEACLRYLTVEKTSDGLKPKLIERSGPTGLLLTTTWNAIHPENETRMLSLTVRDDRAQTAGILRTLAEQASGRQAEEVDLAPWQALQTWLALAGCHEVTIPYAAELASLSDPRAVRIRRDFSAVLNLVRSHALLHQATRDRNEHGSIIATLVDYAAVYELAIDSVNEGVKASVPPGVRAAVDAVAEIFKETENAVSIRELAERLGIDDSATRRRVRVALDAEYLVNLANEKGEPGGRKKNQGKTTRLVTGEPMPAETSVLPSPDELREKYLPVIPPEISDKVTKLAAEKRVVFRV